MKNNNYNLILKERIKNYQEPALDISILEENKFKKISDLVECFNNEYNTSFWIDKKNKEIIDSNIYNKKGKEEKFFNFIDYLEKNGFDNIPLVESRASKKNTIYKLYESELDKAEIILASQLITEKLQKIIENLSSTIYEEVIPISDKIKVVFNKKTSDYWIEKVKGSLDNLIKTTIESKDIIFRVNNYLEKITEGESLSDEMIYSLEKKEEEKNNLNNQENKFDEKEPDELENEKPKIKELENEKSEEKEEEFRKLKTESKQISNVKIKNYDDINEAIKIILEDIKLGMDENIAIKSASIITGINEEKIRKKYKLLIDKKKFLNHK